MCEDCPIHEQYLFLKMAVETILRQDFNENFLPSEKRELLLHYLEEVQESECIKLSKLQILALRRTRVLETTRCVEGEAESDSGSAELQCISEEGGQA